MAKQTKATIVLDARTKEGRLEIKKLQTQAAEMAKQAKKTKGEVSGLSGRFRELASNVAIIEGPLGGTAGRFSALASQLGRISPLAVAAGVSITGLTVAFANGIKVLQQAEQANFRIAAQLEATGFSAGFSAAKIEEMAETIAAATLESTAGVQDAASALLAFSTVSGDAFERTLVVAADLSAVMGTSLTSNVRKLGKALEDPTTGLTRLKDAGVIFTAEQTQLIEGLVESGRLMDAQSAILDVVEGKYEGAGAAAGGGLAGGLDLAKQGFDELTKALVEESGVVPALNKFFTAVGNATRAWAKSFDGTPLEKIQEDLDKLIAKEAKLQKQRETQTRQDADDTAVFIALTQKRIAAKEAELVAEIALNRDPDTGLTEDQTKEAAAKAAAEQAARDKITAKELADFVAKEDLKILKARQFAEKSKEDLVATENARHELKLAALKTELDTTTEQHGKLLALQRSIGEQVELEEEAHLARLAKIKEDAAKKQLEDDKEVAKARGEIQLAQYDAAIAGVNALSKFAEDGSKAQRALFLVEQGVALARAVVAMNLAITQATASAPFPANLPAISHAQLIGAASIAGIAGATVAGSRATGGSVQQGRSYFVGERGPEVITMAGGDGVVTPTADLAPTINIQVIEDASKAGQITNEGETVKIAVAAFRGVFEQDMASGKGMASTMQQRFNLTRRTGR